MLRGEMRENGIKGGESNGECGHEQPTSDERVRVAVVHLTHLRYPGSDSRHSVGEDVYMSRKSGTYCHRHLEQEVGPG